MPAVPSNAINSGQFSVPTGTAVLIIPARADRKRLTITNLTGAQQVYLGPSIAGTTSALGHVLPATVGASITLETTAAIFGLSLTAAQTISYIEEFS